MSPKYTAIIFDIGDVLFKWSPETKTSISSQTLRDILSSPTWFDYERGRLSQSECYAKVGEEFILEPNEIARAFQQARDSLQADDNLISLIRQLKAQMNSQLQVFAMSNVSLPDYEVLRTKPADWSIFDQVFTSGAAGERKPNLGFFRQVLSTTGVDPHSTIFVDDRSENVLSARSLGLYGIIFDNPESVGRALRNLIGDPVARGRDFLEQNAGRLFSVTDRAEQHAAMELRENFAQLLILEATGERGGELHQTLQWVQEVLRNRAYLDGTRYYETPECFLFFTSRLLASSGDQELHTALKPLLKERVQERIGAAGDALALAMRIIVTDFVGIRNEVDLRALLPLQCEDGGWETGWIYKYGSSGIRIGNRGLTTALAVKAVEAMNILSIPPAASPIPTLIGSQPV
ncbi:hypothetical protein C0991_005915 [Blastosporella zonata]|nr:hypothetical protein C0991_005915 [Blastosporella zonata]